MKTIYLEILNRYKEANKYWVKYGITLSLDDYFVIKYILDNKGAKLSEVKNTFGKDKSNMYRQLNKLVKKEILIKLDNIYYLSNTKNMKEFIEFTENKFQ